MKRLIVIVMMCFIEGFLFYLHQHKQSLSGFNCSGLMVMKANTFPGIYSYVVDVRMYFTNAAEGFYILNGTFSANDKTYELQRIKHFSYQLKNDKDLYDIIITKENISTFDNTLKRLADQILMPLGSSFLPQMKRIDKNALLLNMLYSPYFICTAT
ncbi:FidL-like protein [Sodalis sp.]|uniref:FidL-like protein n=1 Tax=Sodalis sp. (in: enterobacteria) TaxID=1898979 RepID=UPI0038738ED4